MLETLLADGTIPAFGLYLARTSALVLAAPLIGLATGFAAYKVGLIVVLAAFFYSLSGAAVTPDVGAIAYGALALREILIGGFLAFLMQLAMLTAQVGSELVGHDMGFAMAGQIDPETGVQTKLIPRVYEALVALGLLACDAHHWLLAGLEESFRRAPVGVMAGDSFAAGLGPMAGLAVANLSQAFAAGISFAAPVTVLLLFVSILVGLLARTVPQLNALEFGFTLRILGGLAAAYLFAPALAPVVRAIGAAFQHSLGRALDALV